MDVFIAISRAKPNTEAHGPKANINLLTWVFDKYLFKWNIYPVKRTASKRTPGHNFQKDEWGSLGKLYAKLICHFPLNLFHLQRFYYCGFYAAAPPGEYSAEHEREGTSITARPSDATGVP